MRAHAHTHPHHHTHGITVTAVCLHALETKGIFLRTRRRTSAAKHVNSNYSLATNSTASGHPIPGINTQHRNEPGKGGKKTSEENAGPILMVIDYRADVCQMDQLIISAQAAQSMES